MITFSCPNCGEKYKFKMLPIPDAGAEFQCAKCNKVCRLIKKGETVFCIQDSFSLEKDEAVTEIFDTFRSEDVEMSPEEIESRLQGMTQDLPIDEDVMIGIVDGPDRGLTYPVTKTTVAIGKTGCDINLQDIGVSREHCQVEIYGNQMIVVRDLKSTGGTFRNGFPINLVVLLPGDKIQIGSTFFTLIQSPKKSS